MARFIILGVVILNLALFSPCSAMEAISGAHALQKGKSVKTLPVPSSPPSVQSSVESIFIDKVEDGAIYSKDGRKFETGGAKVIDNSRKAARTKAAELFFENGNLVEVILK